MAEYEFTGETMRYKGHILHRIRLLLNGLPGGWIESEANLSQADDCWVCGEAKVYGNAEVYGYAIVSNNAEVYGDAKVWYHAELSEIYD